MVAAQTQDSIARLWQEIALEHGLPLHGAEAAPERGAAPSFEMDGPVPASRRTFRLIFLIILEPIQT